MLFATENLRFESKMKKKGRYGIQLNRSIASHGVFITTTESTEKPTNLYIVICMGTGIGILIKMFESLGYSLWSLFHMRLAQVNTAGGISVN